MSFKNKSSISATDLSKEFIQGEKCIRVLNGINLTIKPCEMVAIIGPSGSGKSTLLHLLGGLDYPTSGKVEINGVDVHSLNENNKSEFRNKLLGFIYQFHHLLPEFSALENVAMPLLIGNISINKAKIKAREMLNKVGLEHRKHHRIGELSGGERQRVAIARALVTNPHYVFADEPTGNLDHKTALQIHEIIIALNHELKTSFVIATHDLTITHKMHKVLTLENGKFIYKGNHSSMGGP